MKKVFTLLALLTCFLGANAQAQWEEVYKVDYSNFSGFPFYVMGYVPEFDNGCMTDFGADYRYATQADLDGDGDAKWKDGESSVGTVKNSGGTEYQKVTGAGPYWHQYIIASDVDMVIDETYKVVASVKSTAAVNANLQFGNWGSLKEVGVTIPESSEFQDVEWEVAGCMYNGKGFICIQPGTSTATIEWQSLTVYHKKKANQRPQVWLEDIENGDAETPWGDLADVKFDDQENNFKVCAWGKERMVNTRVDENGNTVWDPFPATIEAEEGNPSNHVFVVHAKPATSESGYQWDNQFWIQSKHAWKSGTTLKIKFRYKASQNARAETQVHKQNPSDYLIWHAIGDINFTDQWQTFDGKMTIADDMANGWSIAFNLNAEVRDAVDFYFDDLSWQYLQLDEGYFASGINTNTATSYDDLDNAIQFEEGESADGTPCLVAVVGEKGNSATYVDQLMISTTRGDDAAFKGATLKPEGKVKNDPDDWQAYAASGNAKLDLPGLGVWKIYLDTEYKSIAFEMLEGTMYEEPDPIAIVTNTTATVVNGQERDDLSDGTNQDGTPNVREEEGGAGETWDNQFFIVANRTLAKGEETVLHFKYKASKDAKTTTQCHGEPGAYIHWGAIGDVNFTTDWQEFDMDFTVPNEADGMKSIAFNMAEIKDACVYEITDVRWYLKDAVNAEGMTYENLINETGDANFYQKEGAGTAPYVPSGISSVVNDKKVPNAIYNLAGQRVSKEYKGIVIKNGAKYIAK